MTTACMHGDFVSNKLSRYGMLMGQCGCLPLEPLFKLIQWRRGYGRIHNFTALHGSFFLCSISLVMLKRGAVPVA